MFIQNTSLAAAAGSTITIGTCLLLVAVSVTIPGFTFYDDSNAAIPYYDYNNELPVVGNAYAQRLATFQETAQVLVDKVLSGNVTSSITLQTTSNQEIKVPSKINQLIIDSSRISSILLTNQDGCGVLGVSVDQGCILVNVVRSPNDTNIVLIQQSAKNTGNLVIDDLNEMFDTQATYHSSYLHHKDDDTAQALDVSGAVFGRDITSAVYVMPKEDTGSMYEKISTLLLDKRIRDSGGFYDAAKLLSNHNNARMTFSIIPIGDNSNTILYQLRTSTTLPGDINVDDFTPLDYLLVDRLDRSQYFKSKFYPLNSILQIILVSSEPAQVYRINTNLIPTVVQDGDTIPTDLETNGWVFDGTASGNKIEGKYLFGTTTSVDADALSIVFGQLDESRLIEAPMFNDNNNGELVPTNNFDDTSIIIFVIIICAAIFAIVLFLKGYNKKF